jgi:hypothetical protein
MSLLIAQSDVVVAFSPVVGSQKPLCKSCCLPVLHQALAQILHIPNRLKPYFEILDDEEHDTFHNQKIYTEILPILKISLRISQLLQFK